MSEKYRIMQGDCLELMREIPAGSVDAVITDPPFGINFKYNSHDDNPQEYEDFMRQFVSQASRVVLDGYIFVWQAMLNAAIWHKWFPEKYRIFAALKNFTQYRPTAVQYSFDPVIFWVQGSPKIKGCAGIRDYHMGNTAKWVAQKSIGHPCPRPVDTVCYIIEMTTRRGQTVLDPFMGSGTTGVACLQTGRKFIGIEKDMDYFKIAADRLAEAAAQSSLFDSLTAEEETGDAQEAMAF